MTINTNYVDGKLDVSLVGRLDTTTAPELESELSKFADAKEVIIDLKDLEYISSAGLRVLLSEQKHMNQGGKMVIRNVNDSIMEVFEITGFVDILTIE